MKCPSCKGYELQPKELEPGLLAASCSSCKGSLLSLLNYRFWVDGQERVNETAIDDSELMAVDDIHHVKLCPKCLRIMAKYKFSNQNSNRLDYCAPCTEIWIDKDEWELIKLSGLTLTLAEIFSDKWQRKLQQERRVNILDARFKDVLGEAKFEQVSTFKRWLEQQPDRQEVLRYLQL